MQVYDSLFFILQLLHQLFSCTNWYLLYNFQIFKRSNFSRFQNCIPISRIKINFNSVTILIIIINI